MTLIEVIVSVAIIAVLSVSVGDSVLSFFRGEKIASGEAYTTTEAQSALSALVAALREADYGADGSYPIVSMSGNALTFFSDSGHGGVAQRLTFQVAGTTLFKSITNPSGTPPAYSSAPISSTVSDSVQNIRRGVPLFTYLDSSGNEITDLSKVASTSSILITLDVTSDAIRQPDYKLQSLVVLRNLRTSY